MKKIQQRIYELLEVAHPDDTPSRITDLFLFVLIALNVLAVIFETVDDLATQYATVFLFFEVFSVAVFTVEYVLRLWTCTKDERYAHPLGGRLKFAASWSAIVDLLAILPFFLPMFLAIDLRMIRALRFFRLLRFLKLSRYSESMRIFGKVLRSERAELMIALFVAGVLLVIGSSFLYIVEHDAQPDKFSSIPAAMWWGVATLTTVGYGDVAPITPIGRFLGAIVAIMGVGMFALPAGILASGFAREMGKRRKDSDVCPHCGESLVEAE
jgi:voltage-gated potassium channel